jgi:acetyltransferase-like isoleucine patch superfamily enzyme
VRVWWGRYGYPVNIKSVLSFRRHFGQVVRDLLLNGLLTGTVIPVALRARLFRFTRHRIHSTARLSPRIFYGANSGLTVGAHSFVNYGCFFDLADSTTIGSHVAIGYECMFVTASHKVGSPDRRAGAPTLQPIVVEDGAWLGARVIVMPGVVVRSGSVIAANSTVTQSTEPNALYAGSPAVLKRRL